MAPRPGLVLRIGLRIHRKVFASLTILSSVDDGRAVSGLATAGVDNKG
jgi:hypothetical protein